MKNKQRGFIVPLMLGIVALLVIGLGSYVYINQRVKVPTINQVENNIPTTSDSSINDKLSTTTTISTTEKNDLEAQKTNSKTITLNLDPDPKYGGVAEPVEWGISVYGPNAKKAFKEAENSKNFMEIYETLNNYRTEKKGELDKQLIIRLSDKFVGQMVVRANYKSVGGLYVMGQEGVVVNQPPGDMVGLKIVPEELSIIEADIPLSEFAVTGIFSSGDEYPIYINDNNIKYEVENTSIAALNIQGDWKSLYLKSPGETKLKVTYIDDNKKVFVAYSKITVTD